MQIFIDNVQVKWIWHLNGKFKDFCEGKLFGCNKKVAANLNDQSIKRRAHRITHLHNIPINYPRWRKDKRKIHLKNSQRKWLVFNVKFAEDDKNCHILL